MSQLIENTNLLLVDTDKKEGVDFCVPCLSWVYLDLFPSYEKRKITEGYTRELTFKNILQLRNIRDSFHPHGHWESTIKNSGGKNIIYWFECLTRPEKLIL